MKSGNLLYAGIFTTQKVIFFIGFAAAMLILAAIVLLSVYTAYKLTHPAKSPVNCDMSSAPLYEDAAFNDSTGQVNLKGWYFKVKDSTKTIILSHGYLQNRMQFDDQTLDFINGFLILGYNVFTFDFRNCGQSEGEITSVGYYERNDLKGAINWVKDKGASNIYLWGVSMGAATSIITAAENAEVDGVIVDCSFADLESYLRKNLPVWSGLPAIPFTNIIMYFMRLMTGIDTAGVSPIKALEALAPRPVLFIHSKDDNGIPVSDSQTMYKKYSHLAPGSAYIWDNHSAKHAQSFKLYPEEYMDKVAAFLKTSEDKRR